MLVRNAMTERLATVTPETRVAEAYELMEKEHFDALPVRDAAADKLIGIIQTLDIFKAAERLDSFKAALQLQVGEVMTQRVVCVKPDDVIERAAKLMEERDVPILPVQDEGRLVGVVTQSDILHAFAEMLGVDSGTNRLTLVVGDRRGQLARIAEIVRDAGVNITHFATFYSHTFQQYKIIVRVECENPRPLVELLEQHHYRVVDVE